MARLTDEQFSDYDCVKASLLKRYKLSTEAYHQKFRNGKKEPSQSYADFAYTLRANMVEWLKSSGVFGDHDKVIEMLCLEQFLWSIPLSVMDCVKFKPEVTTAEKAAELADAYELRHQLSDDDKLSVAEDPKTKS
ncbi:hypothetical protein HPB47_023396, partial [Ixodes persulcatus]